MNLADGVSVTVQTPSATFRAAPPAGQALAVTSPTVTFTAAAPTGASMTVVPVAGPVGAAGASGDAYLLHPQPTPAATWSFTHTLGRYPNVELIRSDGSVIDSDVTLPDTSHVVVTFAAPTAGFAVLS